MKKLLRALVIRGRFFLKAFLLLGSMIALWQGFSSRYFIGWDPQNERCFPNYRLFLVDSKNHQLAPGNLYAFAARGTAPVVDEGTRMVKRLVAIPGDVVTIHCDNFEITVNGQPVGKGLQLAKNLGPAKNHFCGTQVLPIGRYWFLGDGEKSFDSRYWGAVASEQIIGRAWPLL